MGLDVDFARLAALVHVRLLYDDGQGMHGCRPVDGAIGDVKVGVVAGEVGVIPVAKDELAALVLRAKPHTNLR